MARPGLMKAIHHLPDSAARRGSLDRPTGAGGTVGRRVPRRRSAGGMRGGFPDGEALRKADNPSGTGTALKAAGPPGRNKQKPSTPHRTTPPACARNMLSDLGIYQCSGHFYSLHSPPKAREPASGRRGTPTVPQSRRPSPPPVVQTPGRPGSRSPAPSPCWPFPAKTGQPYPPAPHKSHNRGATQQWENV